MLTVLDLFSGIGGFSLGLERTGGFKTIAFCEIDPFARKVLKRHWPDVEILEDITRAGFHHAQADVICGGFPCQDISEAGLGAGIAGKRSGLWTEMVRAIRLVEPRYVIVENVAMLLGRGMGQVLRDLAEIGYDAEWDCIPANFVGSPQQRDRVWIVAYPSRSKARRPFIFNRIREIAERWPHQTSQAGGRSRMRRAAEWDSEPGVCRVVDGVSPNVDRVGARGNAVVPQIPELIGRAILTAEQLTSAA